MPDFMVVQSRPQKSFLARCQNHLLPQLYTKLYLYYLIRSTSEYYQKKKVNLLSVFRFWHSLVHWIISGSLICPLYLIPIPMMQVYTWPSIVLHQTDVFGTTNHSVNAVNMVRILVRNEKKSICSSAIKVNSESTCIISFLEMRCC
jgi:hypothetical protein